MARILFCTRLKSRDSNKTGSPFTTHSCPQTKQQLPSFCRTASMTCFSTRLMICFSSTDSIEIASFSYMPTRLKSLEDIVSIRIPASYMRSRPLCSCSFGRRTWRRLSEYPTIEVIGVFISWAIAPSKSCRSSTFCSTWTDMRLNASPTCPTSSFAERTGTVAPNFPSPIDRAALRSCSKEDSRRRQHTATRKTDTKDTVRNKSPYPFSCCSI